MVPESSSSQSGADDVAVSEGGEAIGARSVRDRPASTTDSDWTVVVADRIEGVVATLRDRTTVPVTKIARAVVFGLIIATGGVAALVLLVIGVLRLHVYLPFEPGGRKLWVTYVGLGAIFVIVGAFMWRKRTARSKE